MVEREVLGSVPSAACSSLRELRLFKKVSDVLTTEIVFFMKAKFVVLVSCFMAGPGSGSPLNCS